MASKKYFDNESTDPLGELFRMNAELQTQIRDLEREIRNQNAPKPIPRLDILSYPTPYEGQRAIDTVDEQHAWYSDGQWRKAGGKAIFEIKVFKDDEIVVTGDGKFKFDIPEDLDLALFVKAEAWVTTVSSSGTIAVSLYNNTTGHDLLSTSMTIDVGEKNTKTAATPAVVNPSFTTLTWGDEIWINVDASGTGAKGLGIAFYAAGAGETALALEGAKGEPGGVTSFQGSWTTSTSYTAGDVVTNNGIVYVAIADHTSSSTDEPGVGVNSDDFWLSFIDLQLGATVNVAMNGGSYPIVDGTYGRVMVGFSGTITAGYLLADAAGSTSVDVLVCDYGGYPPSGANSIVASAPLTLTTAVKNFDSTLTGWTTHVDAGDIIVFKPTGTTLITKLTAILFIEKD